MMRKGMVDMVTISRTIDKIIQTSSRTPSKQEAQKVLRSCGIFDQKNNIKPAYRNIITGNGTGKNGTK